VEKKDSWNLGKRSSRILEGLAPLRRTRRGQPCTKKKRGKKTKRRVNHQLPTKIIKSQLRKKRLGVMEEPRGQGGSENPSKKGSGRKRRRPERSLEIASYHQKGKPFTENRPKKRAVSKDHSSKSEEKEKKVKKWGGKNGNG